MESTVVESLMGLSGAGLVGLAVGFALKKAFKIAIFCFGALIILAIFFEYYGMIEINEEVLVTTGESAKTAGISSFTYLKNWIADMGVSLGIGAMVGFALGFKLG